MHAIIRENNANSRHRILARPTLRVQSSDGTIREVPDCVEIREGNLVRAFLPPSQGGFVLTLESSAGPEAIYKVFDLLRRWYCAEIRG